MHVGDGIDTDRIAEHTVDENEWKTAHDDATQAKLGARVGMRRSGSRERDEQFGRALHGRVEPQTAAQILLLVAVGGSIELLTRCRRELDLFHDRF